MINKAKDLRREIVTIAKDFSKEWQKELSCISNPQVNSGIEFIAELAGIISTRNEFGKRYDRLVKRLDEKGNELLKEGDDPNVIMEITEAIDDVFEESRVLNLGITASGDIEGHLGNSEFKMDGESYTIQKSWHYKYNNNPEIRKQLEVRRKEAADIKAQFQNEYNKKLEKYKAEVSRIEKEKDEKIKKETDPLTFERDRSLEQIKKEYEAQKGVIQADITANESKLESAEKLLPTLSFFKFRQKQEVQACIESTKAKLNELRTKLNCLSEDYNRNNESTNEQYRQRVQQIIKEIEGKYKKPKEPKKPDILLTEREKRLNAAKEEVRSIIISEGGVSDANTIKNYLPQEYKNLFYSAVKALEEEGEISVQRLKYSTYYEIV